MADIMIMAQEELRVRGAADAAALAALAVAGEADGTALIAQEEAVPSWRRRDYSAVPVGTPYKWKGQVYTLLQQHDAANQPDWSPDNTHALWSITHTRDPERAKPYVAPNGTSGMYMTDECCTENGATYRSLIDNNVYSPAEYPQGWAEVNRGEILHD